jgi:drug/metabolite transporter (DMT)-like permease
MKLRSLINVAIAGVIGFALGFLNAKVFASVIGLHAGKPILAALVFFAFAFTWLVVEVLTIQWARILALTFGVVASIGFGFYGLLENTNPTRGAIGYGIPALLAGALLGAILGFVWDKIRKNTPDAEPTKNDGSYIEGGGLSL